MKILTPCQADGTVANVCIRGVSLALDSGNCGLHRFQRVLHLRNVKFQRHADWKKMPVFSEGLFSSVVRSCLYTS